MTQLHRDLVAIKARIDSPDKWCHDNRSGFSPGRECILWAGVNATGSTSCLINCRGNAALAALDAQVPFPYTRLTTYNDASSTTHADIMALCDRAIAAAKPPKIDWVEKMKQDASENAFV